MLSKKIDYWLLRPLVHSRNRTYQEDLNRQASNLPFNQEQTPILSSKRYKPPLSARRRR